MNSNARKVSPVLSAADSLFPYHARELKRMRADALAAQLEPTQGDEQQRQKRVVEETHQRLRNASVRYLAAAREAIAGFFDTYARGECINQFDFRYATGDLEDRSGRMELWGDHLYAIFAEHKEMLVEELRTQGWVAHIESHRIVLYMLDDDA